LNRAARAVRHASSVARSQVNAAKAFSPSAIRALAPAYARALARRRHYRALSVPALLATRTSDTAFVFGSGRSLLDIAPEDWARIALCNTIGFNEFVREWFVRLDYHIIGEVIDINAYAKRMRENANYANAVILVQEGWRADDSNNLVGLGLLPDSARIFRYRRTARGRYAPPSDSFGRGLVHGWNSSISSTNFALLMGYRTIVLAGIDLYDRQYFWLDEGERREGIRPEFVVEEPFAMHAPVIEMFERWRALLEPQGIRLLVYDPRSLLTQALDVFSWDEA
jgi:hypothetical protein